MTKKIDFLEKSIQNPKECPYLDYIKNETKKYEGRLQSKIKEWNLFVGKRIKFYDQDKKESFVLCEITELLTFNDFGEAYDLLGTKLIPNKTKNEVIKLYNNLFHYKDEIIDNVNSSKMIKDNGVVAIGLKLIIYS